jgi:tRNA nucleotidyltransferase/poly(A) polymerase
MSNVLKLQQHIDSGKIQVYIVGGYVRDRLLNKQTKDHDFVVVGGNIELMLSCGFKQVGADFPVFLADNGDEYALARIEKKVGPGYNGFETLFSPDVTLKDDLYRRDLTINAMARLVLGWNSEGHAKLDDEVIDYFDGIDHLNNGLICHVSDAFAEDPVRTLRAARFAARYDFGVASETITLMSKMGRNGEYNHLVPERVWKEVESALQEPYSNNFFDVLYQTGHVYTILPGYEYFYNKERSSLVHKSLFGASIPIKAFISGLSSYTLIELKAPKQTISFVRGLEKITSLPTPTSAEDIMVLAETLDLLRNNTMFNLFKEFVQLSSDDDFIILCIEEARNIHFRDLDKSISACYPSSQYGELVRTERLLAIQALIQAKVK